MGSGSGWYLAGLPMEHNAKVPKVEIRYLLATGVAGRVFTCGAEGCVFALSTCISVPPCRHIWQCVTVHKVGYTYTFFTLLAD